MAFALAAPAWHGVAQDYETDSSGVLRQARLLVAKHQPEEAARVLDSFLSTHAEDADALTLLAQIHVEQGDRSTAKELLTKALAASPNSPAANITLGKLMLEQHRDPEAMDRFETVLDIDLRDREARQGELSAATELAMSARRDNHQDAALKVLEHARSKLPDDPKLLLDLGIQATEMGLLPEASDSLQAARKLDPSDPDIVYALGRLEMQEQHLQAAETDLRAYLAKRPEDASAHFGLGKVMEAGQRTAEAKAEFERSIQLQPAQTESYYELGQIELEVQHDAQAAPLFEKVLARDADHGGALTGMGIIAFRGKNYAQADQYLAHAEKAAPNYQPAHYYRGLALARLGQKDESQRELQTAAAMDREQQGAPGALNGVSENGKKDAPPR
ncbi:MAG TPA: tetratricopeptide repeat protein [Acidobacteriaceae bacterium]|nr:tetratricopeptide repeat protein [Acidobacteriaceae bacterium]